MAMQRSVFFISVLSVFLTGLPQEGVARNKIGGHGYEAKPTADEDMDRGQRLHSFKSYAFAALAFEEAARKYTQEQHLSQAAVAYSYAALSYEAAGNKIATINAFTKAVDINTKFALRAHEQGQYQDAVDAYKHSIHLYVTKHEFSRAAKACLGAAKALTMLGKEDEASALQAEAAKHQATALKQKIAAS